MASADKVIIGNDSVVIGSPVPKTDKDGSDGVVDPDTLQERNLHSRGYSVSCTPRYDAVIFSAPDLRRHYDDTKVNQFWTMGVIYFITARGKQFIYGTLADPRGSSDGRPVYALASDWDCKLSH